MAREHDDTSPRPVHAIANGLLAELRARANPDNVAGMGRFGISQVGTLGVTVADVRSLARKAKREIGRDPEALLALARALWGSGVHEARIMTSVLVPPARLTRELAEAWLLDVDSWDTCDQLCGNALWKTPWAWDAVAAWCAREETFVKRAGMVMAAQLACKDKAVADTRIIGLIDIVVPACEDERNDVKKGASWALRCVGKRNATCNAAALAACDRLLESLPQRGGTPGERAARWVARDVTRELRSEAVRWRLGIV